MNAAGITQDEFLLKMEEEDFDKVIQVNLKVTVIMAASLQCYMLTQCYLLTQCRCMFSLNSNSLEKDSPQSSNIFVLFRVRFSP